MNTEALIIGLAFFVFTAVAGFIFFFGFTAKVITDNHAYKQRKRYIELDLMTEREVYNPDDRGNYPAVRNRYTGGIARIEPGNDGLPRQYITLTGKPEPAKKPVSSDYYVIQHGDIAKVVQTDTGKIFEDVKSIKAKELPPQDTTPRLTTPNTLVNNPTTTRFTDVAEDDTAEDFDGESDTRESGVSNDFEANVSVKTVSVSIPQYLTRAELEDLRRVYLEDKGTNKQANIENLTTVRKSGKSKKWQAVSLWWDAGCPLPE